MTADDGGPELFDCKYCRTPLLSGDREGNNLHFLALHVAEYHRELESNGLSELGAHLKTIALTEQIREVVA